jgi:hypothetical protein
LLPAPGDATGDDQFSRDPCFAGLTRCSLLTVRFRDDGVGGAGARRGSGLTGLRDRVEAVGGSMTTCEPPGARPPHQDHERWVHTR